MNQIKIILLLFFINMISISYSEDRFLITPYYAYKTHLYIVKQNHYTENYSGWGLQSSFIINKFMMPYLKGEVGTLTNAKTANQKDQSGHTIFPINATRTFYQFGAGNDFYFYTNPENQFYFGLEYDFIHLNPLVYDEIRYAQSEQSFSAIGFSMGDRFLLFPSWILNLEVNFTFPLKQLPPPLQDSSVTQYSYKSYLITLKLGIGILF